MSRIGKKPITIPEGVQVTHQDGVISVKGPLGEMSYKPRKEMRVVIEGQAIKVEPKGNTRQHRSYHGLTRTLINNMVVGVKEGYTKQLEVKGVGYRAAVEGDKLELHVGFSHSVSHPIPEGIKIEAKKNIITISGFDKQLVGEVAAQIRRVRPPEPYKGKGIRYVGEAVRKKAGKAAKTAQA